MLLCTTRRLSTRAALSNTTRWLGPQQVKCRQFFSTNPARTSREGQSEDINVEELLSKPTWSVSSLLPPKGQSTDLPEVSSKQLHHLLRLSALPPPKNKEEEARMLQILASQLHFVKEIQKVDTTGVEPLRSLRDETPTGEMEAELG